MSLIIVEKDELSYELNKENLTAKVISSPNAKDDIFIPRSIVYGSDEYIITRIEENSFKINLQIRSLSFSDDSELCTIGNRAFDCSSIEIIYIPSTVQSLDAGWCRNTRYLNHVYLSSMNKNYKYLDGNKKIIVGKSNKNDKKFDKIIFASREITRIQIPSEIKEIGPYSFSDSNLHKITFESNSNIEKICRNAFSNCHFEFIEIPPKVNNLEDGWLGQRWIEVSISISKENKNFKYINESAMIVGKSDQNKDEFNVLVIASSKIKEAIIPSTIEYISSYAFFYCQSLEKVEFLPDSKLKFIGENAFALTSINEISIPKSCQTIQKNAFDSCKELKKINFQHDSELYSIPSKLMGDSKIDCFTITKNIQNLEPGWCYNTDCLTNVLISEENKTFSYLDSKHKIIVKKSNQNEKNFDVLVFASRDLNEIYIPSTIKYIEPYCLHCCENLKKIEFDKNSQLIKFGKKSFSSIPIKTIEIPSSVIEIDSYCFSFCKQLKKFIIPIDSKLKSIKKYAFYYTKICQFFIPPELTEFNFYDSKELNEICISPLNNNFKYLNDDNKKVIVGKKNLKGDVFDTILLSCRDIRKVFIPSSIKYIKSNAFSDCIQLDEVTFEENSQLISIEDKAFNATNIKEITIPPHVKHVGESCFSSCSSIEKVEFMKNSELTFFCNYLFDMSNIEFLSIPSSLKKFSNEWCSSTYKLKSIQLPIENKNLTYLDKEKKIIGVKSKENSDVFDVIVFACRDVNNIIIPTTIKRIGSYSFSDCAIQKVFIPKSVKKICDFTFYNCKRLRNVEFDEDSNLKSLGYHCFGFTLIENFCFPKKMKTFDLNALLSCNSLKSIEFLSEDITFDYFLCTNDPVIMSFPNAKRICIDDKSFQIFSESVVIYTSPNFDFEY